MARPKKAAEDKQRHRIPVNLNDAELDLLDVARGEQSRAGWFRDRLTAGGSALHPATVDYLSETMRGVSRKGKARQAWLAAGCPDLPE